MVFRRDIERYSVWVEVSTGSAMVPSIATQIVMVVFFKVSGIIV
jgi:hypothetical protein